MIAAPFNRAFLGECICPTLSMKHPELLNLLIRSIDAHDGVILGSTIIRYLLNCPYGWLANDLDVLLRDRESYNNFVASLQEGVESCNTNVCVRNVHYTFNTLIDTSDGADTLITFSDSTTNLKLRVHAIFLKSGGTPELTSIHTDTYIKELFNQFFIFDFTRSVYYRSKIYSRLGAVRYVEVRVSEIDNDQERHRVIDKYVRRGITINIVPDEPKKIEAVPAVVPLDLQEAKRHYQKLGLVVLPLVTTDANQAGKAPACTGWNRKDREYDFDASRYDNIGILCGRESGIVCIDVDQKDDGMLYFHRMVSRYGLPKCPTQVTPNSGRHYIFKYDHSRMASMKAKIKAAKIGHRRIGIDMWIQKCQFVVEPSVNQLNKKSYQWTTPITDYASIPELPEWIYDLYFSDSITEDGEIIAGMRSLDNNSDTSSTDSLRSGATTVNTESSDDLVKKPSDVVKSGSSDSTWIITIVLTVAVVMMLAALLLIWIVGLVVVICLPAHLRGRAQRFLTHVAAEARHGSVFDFFER
ncbi:hypothetical protein PHYBOEH_010727 [Phytophthora boehmeriae]|uniref:DNA primase/polymerase bifunctional N-terminal domain-containing protein n=1 Tax=Phytophthora boehmeriae TaxID=109152 RepID=A0A8T1VP82_9STRA|nr:hypothetical protein PHYBOEH_010727 [Phytophthora boehmeriae]